MTTFDEPSPVFIDQPERMSLLGLMLAGLLKDGLQAPWRQRLARGIHGDLQIQAGRMCVTLRFAPSHGRALITVLSGKSDRPRAWVKGSLAGLLGLAAATDILSPVVRREVTFGGNVLWLLRVAPLLLPPTLVRDRLTALLPKPAGRKSALP